MSAKLIIHELSFVCVIAILNAIAAYSSCSWLNPEACNSSKPVLGLVFIHMRKAGGTNIVNMLKKWMLVRGCAPNSIMKDGTYGIHGLRKGVPILFDEERERTYASLCPDLDFSNNEYSCVDGRSMLRQPSPKYNHSFEIFTILRDPIERIGSQAFYRSGPGVSAMNIMRNKRCGKVAMKMCRLKPQLPACDCIVNTTHAVLAFLRDNDRVWLEWAMKANTDPNEFMGDNYASNYYIRRLIKDSIDTSQSNTDRRESCDETSNNCESYFWRLQRLSHRIHCVLAPKGQPEAPIDIIEGLAIAKKLLENHIDFIITEQMNTPAAHRVLRRVLHDPSYDPPATKVNAGAIAISRKKVSYTEYMSPAVIEYFRRDNAQDIELYNFAVGLFEEREKTGDL
jgi:hypothetical protein